MTRKYKLHRYYAVLWWRINPVSLLSYGPMYRNFLTKKEAIELIGALKKQGACRTELVKRIHTWDADKGEMSVEEI